MESRGFHLRYVDGLRGVAVLAVISYHAISEANWAFPWLAAPMQMAPAWWFSTLVAKGAHGVDLFFVISGFCLAYPALARTHVEGKTSFDVRDFFAKRLVRIVPPYYASIFALIAAVLLAVHVGLHRPSAVAADFTPISIVQQLLFFDRHADFVNGSYWTLAIELRWYLAFPFLLLLYARSMRLFYTLLAGCVIAFNVTQLRAIDIGTLPGFMLGIVAADWRLREPRFAHFAIPAFLVAVDVALLLEPTASAPSRFGLADDAGFFLQTNFGWQLASFFFVVTAGQVAWLRRLLEFPALLTIGACAYGIYLVHQPIISFWDSNGGAALGPAANFASAGGLAIMGGLLFSAVAERPFLANALRARMLRSLENPLARIFTFLGLPARLELVEVKRPTIAMPVAVTEADRREMNLR